MKALVWLTKATNTLLVLCKVCPVKLKKSKDTIPGYVLSTALEMVCGPSVCNITSKSYKHEHMSDHGKSVRPRLAVKFGEFYSVQHARNKWRMQRRERREIP